MENEWGVEAKHLSLQGNQTQRVAGQWLVRSTVFSRRVRARQCVCVLDGARDPDQLRDDGTHVDPECISFASSTR